jgi:hypothetical protein
MGRFQRTVMLHFCSLPVFFCNWNCPSIGDAPQNEALCPGNPYNGTFTFRVVEGNEK